MQKLSCLIVEDEPLAAEILQSYIAQVMFLKLEHVCTDAISAFDIVNKNHIDVIFLDIHLPKLKGIDFLKALNHPPKVIITSAYKEYALQGFELEITDYLLKPYSFARFLKAVNRLHSIEEHHFSESGSQREFRFFNVNKKKVKVFLDEILYVESLKDYVKIHTKDRFLITKFQLGEIEKYLNEKDFIRIHRSFLVAKKEIESFSSTEVEVGGVPLPIGRNFTGTVKAFLEDHNKG